MGLNQTPSGERIHIGFFGRRNAGKSSLVNAVTGQDLCVVSDTKGTTTDPVSKTMELLPLGPVVIIDTPGFDDEGELGLLRVKKASQVLNKTDIAVLVSDAENGLADCDKQLIELFEKKNIHYVVVFNKADLIEETKIRGAADKLFVSAKTGFGVHELKERLAKLAPDESNKTPLVKDILKPEDLVVLVTPIDEAAPKGRIILPQQMMIREILDADAYCVVTKETTFVSAVNSLGRKPRLVITDSQAFAKVNAEMPEGVELTSFSILMARHKGLLNEAVKGVTAIDRLKDGDTVLISEGCTHHRQCGDIGSVKLPALLKKYTGKMLNIELSGGTGFPEDLSKYALIMHCGGCMLSERELVYRMKCAADAGVPMTNYGTAIAYMNGILERSITVLPDAVAAYESGKKM